MRDRARRWIRRALVSALCGGAVGVGLFHIHLLLATLRHLDAVVVDATLLTAILVLDGVHAIFGAALAILIAFAISAVFHRALVDQEILLRSAALILALPTLALAATLQRSDDDFSSNADAAEFGPAASSRPNILLLISDSLRADLLDDPLDAVRLMPNVEQLRAASLDYRQVQASSSWTPPSMASLLTGARPSTLNAHRGRLPDDAESLAEILHAAGYETIGISDNHLTHPSYGFAQGFESYWQKNNCILFAQLWFSHWRMSRWYERIIREFGMQYRGAEVVNDRFFSWTSRRDRSRPFFAMIHYMDTHYPYYVYDDDPNNVSNRADPRFFVRYADAQLQARFEPLPPFARSHLPEGQLENLRLRYEGSAQQVDRHVGELFRWLHHENLWNDTIVIFTADHGEELYDHDFLGHGRTLYQESVRVPLIIKPARAAMLDGEVITTPANLSQLAPTVLTLIGQEPPAQHPVPLPLHPTGLAEASFSELDRSGVSMVAGRFDRMKLIFSRGRNGREKLELYDLVEDPLERRNLSEQIESLPRELLQQFATACEQLSEMEGAVLDAHQLELLRGLGYLR